MIVDSFGWIEWLTEGELADKYADYLRSPEKLITPVIVIYEVYKKLKQILSEEFALRVVAKFHETKIIPLTADLALLAPDVSLKWKLPMADAFVYATALSEKCPVVTFDPHFERLRQVIIPKKNDRK